MDTSMVTINLLAVLISAIASLLVGSIWYGPMFGKLFMTEMGMNNWTPKKQESMKNKMILTYFLQFIASLVMFFVLDWYIVTSPHTGIYGGMANAFGLWLGFVVPLAGGNALWGGNYKLFWLSIGNMLITLLIAGAIMGVWN